MQIGKVPPQAVDVEEKILGVVLTIPDSYSKVLYELREDMFYKNCNRYVFRAIKELGDKDFGIDIITVAEELKRAGRLEEIGGVYFLTLLTQDVISSVNLEYWIAIIKQKYIRREAIHLGDELVTRAYEDDVDEFDILSSIFDVHKKLSDNIYKSNIIQHVGTIAEDNYIKYQNIAQGKAVNGVPVMFRAVRRFVPQFSNGDLIIKAARPGMGKTAEMVSEAKLYAESGFAVAIFSEEMSKEQLTDRFVAQESGLPVTVLRSRELSLRGRERMASAVKKLKTLPIYIEDNLKTIYDVQPQLQNMINKYGVKIAYFDYVQRSRTGQKQPREQEISEIAQTLKTVAKRCNVPVVAYAQLSRAVETRGGDRRPMLSDLRECLSLDTSDVYLSNGFQSNPLSPEKILSLHKQIIKPMQSINIPKSKNFVYRLKTKTGRILDCTENHPILTSSGYVKLKYLEKSSSIALACDWKDDSGVYIPESRFIGWMIGNGCMYGYNSPSFITNDPVISDDFVYFIEDRFGFHPRWHKHYSSRVYQWDLTYSNVRVKGGNLVSNWLKENDLWGNKAVGKHIPEWFMKNANTKSIIELIQGLYETDGSIAVGKRVLIKYATTSILLAHQLLYLLAKIGIVANLDNGYFSKKATTNCYGISLASGEQQMKFKELIPLRGRKQKKLELIKFSTRASHHQNKLSRNTAEEIHHLMIQKVGNKDRVQIHGERTITKRHFESLLAKYPNELESYKWIASKNIFWDGVDSITEVGEVDVFDRHVPESNNLVVNGIIVHNSGNLEIEADAVMFIFRPAYYKVTELDDGRSTEGYAEILIEKHRQGSTGMAVLEFEAPLMKFRDVEQSEEEVVMDERYETNTDLPF